MLAVSEGKILSVGNLRCWPFDQPTHTLPFPIITMFHFTMFLSPDTYESESQAPTNEEQTSVPTYVNPL